LTQRKSRATIRPEGSSSSERRDPRTSAVRWQTAATATRPHSVERTRARKVRADRLREVASGQQHAVERRADHRRAAAMTSPSTLKLTSNICCCVQSGLSCLVIRCPFTLRHPLPPPRTVRQRRLHQRRRRQAGRRAGEAVVADALASCTRASARACGDFGKETVVGCSWSAGRRRLHIRLRRRSRDGTLAPCSNRARMPARGVILAPVLPSGFTSARFRNRCPSVKFEKRPVTTSFRYRLVAGVGAAASSPPVPVARPRL